MKGLASLNWRRVVLIVGTLLVAFGSGHVMQTILVEPSDVATTGDAPDAAPVLRNSEEPPELPVPPAATLTPILHSPVSPRGRIADDLPLPKLPVDREVRIEFQQSCETLVDARPGSGGLLLVDVYAPCLAGTTIVLVSKVQ